jgi:hypothetical protein
MIACSPPPLGSPIHSLLSHASQVLLGTVPPIIRATSGHCCLVILQLPQFVFQHQPLIHKAFPTVIIYQCVPSPIVFAFHILPCSAHSPPPNMQHHFATSWKISGLSKAAIKHGVGPRGRHTHILHAGRQHEQQAANNAKRHVVIQGMLSIFYLHHSFSTQF